MNQKQLPEKINQSYQTAVHIAYAIVITQTFDVVTRLFGSPMDFINNANNATVLKFPALVLAYTVFVSSWIGYARSISKHGYREGVFGTMRFLMDLFVVFMYYNLINLLDPRDALDTTHHYNYDQTFVLLPIIFIAYLVWDLLKYTDQASKDKDESLAHVRRISITVYYLTFFVVLSYSYFKIPVFVFSNAVYNKLSLIDFINWKTELSHQNDYWYNFIFIVIAIVLIVLYRADKWKDTYRRAKRKPRRKPRRKKN